MASIIIPDVAVEPSMVVAATAAAPKILPSTLLDVEAYSARYSGETKLQRLVHIAQMASSATSASGPQPEVAVQAYQLAERHLKQTGNLRRYLQIFGPQRGKDWMLVASSIQHGAFVILAAFHLNSCLVAFFLSLSYLVIQFDCFSWCSHKIIIRLKSSTTRLQKLAFSFVIIRHF